MTPDYLKKLGEFLAEIQRVCAVYKMSFVLNTRNPSIEAVPVAEGEYPIIEYDQQVDCISFSTKEEEI